MPNDRFQRTANAAAQVFALGIHMTSKEPSAAEMWRWVRQGGAGR